VGVSILMTPGPIGRNRGKQVDITPGWRSEAAARIRDEFGNPPLTLTTDDIGKLDLMGAGASVYTRNEENIWRLISAAIAEHGAVTIVCEY